MKEICNKLEIIKVEFYQIIYQIIITCIFAFIVGVIYFQIGTGLESGLQNRFNF